MRVYGPYKHRNGYVIRIVTDAGTNSVSFKDEAPARARAEELKAIEEKEPLTIHDHIKSYLSFLEVCKNKPLSIRTARQSLECLFRGYEDLSAAHLDTKKAREIYLALAKRVAVDTHRISLTRVRHMWRYLIDEGVVKSNPWTEVSGIGKRVKGKKKLTDDETRILFRDCLSRASEHDGSLGIVIALLLGLRGGEVRNIQKRHFDRDCSVLRVYSSKTETGKRSILVPEELQKLVKARIESLAPEDRLFARTHDWLNHVVKAACVRLKLPGITGHSLRGIHASLATRAGATSELVAATLGHSKTDVTEEHYSGADAIADRDVSNAEDLLLH
jgi:integrase